MNEALEKLQKIKLYRRSMEVQKCINDLFNYKQLKPTLFVTWLKTHLPELFPDLTVNLEYEYGIDINDTVKIIINNSFTLFFEYNIDYSF